MLSCFQVDRLALLNGTNRHKHGTKAPSPPTRTMRFAAQAHGSQAAATFAMLFFPGQHDDRRSDEAVLNPQPVVYCGHQVFL